MAASLGATFIKRASLNIFQIETGKRTPIAHRRRQLKAAYESSKYNTVEKRPPEDPTSVKQCRRTSLDDEADFEGFSDVPVKKRRSKRKKTTRRDRSPIGTRSKSIHRDQA